MSNVSSVELFVEIIGFYGLKISQDIVNDIIWLMKMFWILIKSKIARNEYLNDKIISYLSNILKEKYPMVSGLFDTVRLQN